jgi:hypothetical protein
MAVSITNPTLSTTIVASEIEANFTDLVNKFGSIDDSDIASNAAITITKLAAYNFEFLMNLTLRGPNVAGAAGDDPIVWSTTEPSLVMGLPGTSADGTYTVISGNWFCTDVGDQTNDFTLTAGYYDTANPPVWTVDTTIATVTNMPANDAAGPNNDNGGMGNITISSGTITLDASDPRFIGINFPNAEGGTFLDDKRDFLSVTLKLRRTDGLRP